MADNDTEIAMNRVTMATVGAIAGLAAWYFSELASDMLQNPRLWVFLVSATMGFFGILMGLVGPLSWTRAAFGAVVLGVLAASLLLWGSFRFEEIDGYFDTPRPAIAMFLVLFIGTPFVSAGLQRRGGARDYALLFDTAWSLLVRYLAGWLFVAVVWGIVFLSDALLKLVGITAIGDLIDIDPVPFALTGLFLGLAMAIMHELRAYISPFLVLRLFRILLPVLTFVVLIFLIALPLRGFGALFGNLSVAATLMSVAIAALTLITSALDRSAAEEVEASVMRLSARGMSVLLVPLCVAAGWAVWLRVSSFGWTPDRVAAGLSALVLLVYAASYAVASLRTGWAGRIRGINPPLALGVVAVAALWLTPLFNAEALSTKSQLNRFAAGKLAVEDLPLWEMKEKWGKPGHAGLVELRTLAATSGNELLAGRLERLDAAESRYAFDQGERSLPLDDATLQEIRDHLKIWPEGQDVTLEALRGLPRRNIDQMREICPTKGGFCGLVLADTNPFSAGEEGLLLLRAVGDSNVRLMTLKRVDGVLDVGNLVFNDAAGRALQAQADALAQALEAGDVRIEPAGFQMISIGGINIIP